MLTFQIMDNRKYNATITSQAISDLERNDVLGDLHNAAQLSDDALSGERLSHESEREPEHRGASIQLL